MDAAAAAALAAADPDRALSLLADMAAATDPRMAAVAARLAGRLALDLARSGRREGRGPGRLTRERADRADGDIDLEASLDALAEARAQGRTPGLGDLLVSRWGRPAPAVAVVVDRSGSMGGRRLAVAAVAAAACAHRAPAEWALIAFSDQAVAVKSLDQDREVTAVVNDVLGLRGYGTTDLAAALSAAAEQLARSRASRRIAVLLSDCRSTAGADSAAAARKLAELAVIAPADDSADAAAWARGVGARFATVDGPRAIPAAVAAVLD